LVGKQRVDVWSAKITGRQAYAVHDQQVDGRSGGAVIAIRGADATNTPKPVFVPLELHAEDEVGLSPAGL
jgi:hypothetical protein